MKRSKVYLGVTTFLLTIAAIAAGKAHNFSRFVPGYFGTKNANSSGLNATTCLHESIPWFTQGTSPCYSVKVNGGTQFPVYTKSSTGQCAGARLYRVKSGA